MQSTYHGLLPPRWREERVPARPFHVGMRQGRRKQLT